MNKLLITLAAGILMGAGAAGAQDENLLATDPPVEADTDSTEITATLTARVVAGFTLPGTVALEVPDDMVADKNLQAQALRSLQAAGVAIDDNAQITLGIEFDSTQLGDTGRQITGLGNREPDPREGIDDRGLYAGDDDPYTGQSYLDDPDFGVSIELGRGPRQALGVDYTLTARLYTLTGEVLWSGTASAVIVGATPEVVGEAMLQHVLEEMGKTVAAKRVVLDAGS